MNRLAQLLARNGHLTFRKKCRDLIIQIFGHEAEINETADVRHCEVFDEYFFRLSTITWDQLAARKLLNPFKWLEFIIVVPLEIAAWSTQRVAAFFGILAHLPKDIPKKINHWVLSTLVSIILSVICGFLLLPVVFLMYASPFVNLAVNLVIGIVRWVLAPARYIVRPTIELMMQKPNLFWGTVLATVFTLNNAWPYLNNYISYALNFMRFSPDAFMMQTAIIGLVSIFTFTALTKTANTLINLYQIMYDNNNQDDAAAEIVHNSQSLFNAQYNLKVRENKEIPDKDLLDAEKPSIIPLLIKLGDKFWIYGRTPVGNTQLTELKLKEKNNIYSYLGEWIQERGTDNIHQKYKNAAQKDITLQSGHFPRREKSATKITETLHALNAEITEIKPLKEQDRNYSWALFFGVEALCYPAKPKSVIPVIEDSSPRGSNLRNR